MADFKGYLIKIEENILPNMYICDYSATPNQVQDKDTYQDITGKLHRDILPHSRSKIEFKTPPLNLREKEDFQSYFPNRKTNPEISVEYWNDETNDYSTGTFYAPDIQYKPYWVTENDIKYQPIRVALIEY